MEKKEIQDTLIEKARKKHKIIKPCGERASLYECFTYHPDKVVFWFNSEDNSTRVLVHNL
jgi:hypothetical protein